MKRSLLDLVRGGETALGAFIGSTGPVVAEIAAWAGYDYMRIDYEHTLSSPETLGEIIRIADAADVPSLVRVSCMDDVTKLLDHGATGIMVPDIETAAQTRDAAGRVKYAPVGHRGMDNTARCVRYGFERFADYLKTANDRVALCVQIESRRGVENLEDILAVEGVDMVTVGKLDLSQSLGVPGQTDHPDVQAAEERIVQTALRHGKEVLLTAGSPEHLRTLRDRGVRFATVAFDMHLVAGAFRERLATFRQG